MKLTCDQKRAICPFTSAWVEASAGSGKTKILVDRVLALLCNGTPPEEILCVTFTKAAASEMQQRIMQRLSLLSRLQESELKTALTNLGLPAEKKYTAHVRTLFNTVLSLPRGLRIQTLHSFAESLLQGFPLEAGVFPAFDVMDEAQSKALFDEAIKTLLIDNLTKNAKNKTHKHATQRHLAPLIKHLATYFSEDSLKACLEELLSMRTSFSLAHLGGQSALNALQKALNLSGTEATKQSSRFTKDAIESLHASLPKDILQTLSNFFDEKASSTNTAIQKKKWINDFCTSPSVRTFKNFSRIFLTDKGTKRKTVFVKDTLTKAQKDIPNILDLVTAWGNSVFACTQRMQTHALFESSKALQVVSQQVLATYEKRKKDKNLLDYDDLLQKSCDLLKNDEGWVLYKLGHRLSHILIDEAQDTSALGWRLIESLMDVFFVGDDSQKTLFVVGDPKQSIYSFQGADPRLFYTMQKHFEHRIKQLSWPFKKLSLNTSFRSSQTILNVVDETFSDKLASSGLGEKKVTHKAFKDFSGEVTLWPILKEKAEAQDAPHTKSFFSEQAQLAFKVALEIHDQTTDFSKSGIMASDIMVLVRKRGPFIPLLVRFLKDFKIPVAGQDRLCLMDALVVQDLLALLRFCLNPEDNLTLATVLKGPFIGLLDDDLIQFVCAQKEKTLWAQLLKQSQTAGTSHAWHTAQRFLKESIFLSQTATIFDFFSHILFQKQGAKKCATRLGGEVYDALDTFLAQTLLYDAPISRGGHAFLNFFENTNPTVKREIASKKNNGVQILTVHGAKGLEAPFVILPDTGTQTTKKPMCLWTSTDPSSKQKIPLLWPKEAVRTIPFLAQAFDNEVSNEMQEYNRLLYVALTRATKKLLICGVAQKNSGPQTWHEKIKKGLMSLKTKGYTISEQDGILSLKSTPQQKIENTPEDKGIEHPPLHKTPPLPNWAKDTQKTQEAHTPPTSLLLEEHRRSLISKADQDIARLRGVLVHALLENLPKTSRDHWQEVKNLTAKVVLQTDASLYQTPLLQTFQEILNQAFLECTQLLSRENLSFLLHKAALREVSLASLQDGNIQKAQSKNSNVTDYILLKNNIDFKRIDFILKLKDHVLLIDYKTDRTPKIEKISTAYKKQLTEYASIIAPLFDAPIQSGIVWTKTGHISWLNTLHNDSFPSLRAK